MSGDSMMGCVLRFYLIESSGTVFVDRDVYLHSVLPFCPGGPLQAQGLTDKRSSPVRDVNENGNVALSVPRIVGADFALDRDKSHCALCLMVAVAGESGILAVALLRELLNLLDLASQQPFKLFHIDLPFWPGL